MRKVLRACLLVVAAILGAADPFDLSERAPSTRPASPAGSSVGARADGWVGAGRADALSAQARPAARRKGE
jgi:hypothetical protein